MWNLTLVCNFPMIWNRGSVVIAILLMFLQTWFSPVKTDSRQGHLSVGVNETNIEQVKDFYIRRLLDIYGNSNHTLSAAQLNTLLKKLRVRDTDGGGKHDQIEKGAEDAQHVKIERNCSESMGHSTVCNLEQCLSGGDIFQIHGLPAEKPASSKELHEMSATILYQAQNEHCTMQKDEQKRGSKPKPGEVWGYGFLAVTFINLCAILGIVFLPLMRQKFYKKMLLFMVALAVGTLVGSALLVLIPDALEIPHLLGDVYIWKVTVVMAGIYLFFLIERLLHLYNQTRKERQAGYGVATANSSQESETLREVQGSVKVHTRARNDSFNMNFEVPDKVLHNGHVQDEQGPVINPSGKQKIKPVAWMVVFGDGVHNFIDGLSIGAAFADSTLAGFSISLAVICEELPHELGDFAILLNAGMSMKKAVLFNFLSACMCYLGLVIGILVGEMTAGSTWIFALAGGMFLYISLVDMLPEVNHAAEVEGRGCLSKKLKVLFLQNVGIIMGYGIILILTKFATQIDLTGS